MSKRKDRQRAESGLIFRDGKLVRKEEWYTTHPTKEMVEAKERQEILDLAKPKLVDETMINDEGIDTLPVVAYFCKKCNQVHRRGKIYTEHKEFASILVVK